MLPKVFKILLIVFGVILIITVVALGIIRFTNRGENGNINSPNANVNLTNKPEVNKNSNSNSNIPLNTNLNTNQGVSDEKKEEEELKRLSSSFAERFGSYSNQSNFENIINLKVYMSKRMQRWADQFVAASLVGNPDNSIYYGLTTKALSVNTNVFDTKKGTAEFIVSTQRREATGSSSNITVFYQDILIKYAKEDGAWKVDEAIWQEKQ